MREKGVLHCVDLISHRRSHLSNAVQFNIRRHHGAKQLSYKYIHGTVPTIL